MGRKLYFFFFVLLCVCPIVFAAPDAPHFIGAMGVSDDQVNIGWSHSNGSTYPSFYTVYRNNVAVGTIPAKLENSYYQDPSLYQDEGLQPSTTYQYKVTATDSSGAESAPSMTVSATTLDASQDGLIPKNRLIDWTSGETVGVPNGITERETICATVKGSPENPQTTTGSISANSTILTVSNVADFEVGHGVSINNAGYDNIYTYNPWPLYTIITAINGNQLTLETPAYFSVTNQVVSHDDSTSIGQAIGNCPANQVVQLLPGTFIVPNGIYISKNNITLRGSGQDKTIIDCRQYSCLTIRGGDGFYNRPSVSLVSGGSKGSTQITVSDATDFNVGTMAKIVIENDKELPTMSVTGYPGVRSQNVVVTGKSGNTLTIHPPLMADKYGTTSKVLSAVPPTSYVGIEDLTLDGRKGSPQIGLGMHGTYGSWVKNVRIKGASNYVMSVSDSMFCEIRHSYLDQGKVAGTNGAGLLMGTTTGCLFEDNIVYKSFPLLEINFGSTGNVFAYNFMIGNTVDTNHGPHNSYNLYEGNIADGFMSDGYFGGESEATFYRNWVVGRSFPLAFKRWSRNFNVVGNQIGADGMMTGLYALGQPYMGNAYFENYASKSAGIYWLDWNPTTGAGIRGILSDRMSDWQGKITVTSGDDRLQRYCSYAAGGLCMSLGIDWGTGQLFTGMSERQGNVITVSGTYNDPLPAEGTEVGIWPRSEGFAERDMDVLTTTIFKHNWYSGWNRYYNDVDESLKDGETLVDSLYLTQKPDWFESLQWPPFGPDKPVQSFEALPAGYRYLYNEELPANYVIPEITFIAPTPSNGASLNADGFTISTSTNIENLEWQAIRIYNSAGALLNTSNVTGTTNTLVVAGYAEGTYYYNASASNAAKIDSTATRTIILDKTSPNVTLTSPTAQTYSTNSVSVQATLNERGSCVYSLDGGSTKNAMSSSNNLTFVASTATLSNGQYTVTLYCVDAAGLASNSPSAVFSVEVQTRRTNGGGGGGGSGGSRTTGGSVVTTTATGNSVETPSSISVSQTRLESGFTLRLSPSQKVTFYVGTISHSLNIDSILGDTVTVTVASSPQTVTLQQDEESKFDLTDDGRYDLSVTLRGVVNNSADIHLKKIDEEIPVEATNVTAQVPTTASYPIKGNSENLFAIQVLVASVACLAIIGIAVLFGNMHINHAQTTATTQQPSATPEQYAAALQPYLKQYLNAGHSPEAFIEECVSKGWKREIVEDVVYRMKGGYG
ncbi:MAG TPA: fibronectin type III domain-containing protein [Acidobacteriota bacterium]|nr:fibronectin type III domain-containing protein [Acidobacteriota bacterium]